MPEFSNLLSKSFGSRLKAGRKKKGLSQKEFAQKLGVPSSYLSEVETGKTKPGLKFLVKIGKAYNISLNWLILKQGDIFIDDEQSETKASMDFGEESESVRELLEYFHKSPLVKVSVIAFSARFLLENEEIIQKDMDKKVSQNTNPNEEDAHV